jgi:hypothetical protein
LPSVGTDGQQQQQQVYVADDGAAVVMPPSLSATTKSVTTTEIVTKNDIVTTTAPQLTDRPTDIGACDDLMQKIYENPTDSVQPTGQEVIFIVYCIF